MSQQVVTTNLVVQAGLDFQSTPVVQYHQLLQMVQIVRTDQLIQWIQDLRSHLAVLQILADLVDLEVLLSL